MYIQSFWSQHEKDSEYLHETALQNQYSYKYSFEERKIIQIGNILIIPPWIFKRNGLLMIQSRISIFPDPLSFV